MKNSNQLETSLQNGKSLLTGYESKLAREEAAPADISSLEKTQRELGVSNAWALNQSNEHLYFEYFVYFHCTPRVKLDYKIHCCPC